MKNLETFIFSLLGFILIGSGAMLLASDYREQAAKEAALPQQAAEADSGAVAGNAMPEDTATETPDDTSEPSEDQ